MGASRFHLRAIADRSESLAVRRQEKEMHIIRWTRDQNRNGPVNRDIVRIPLRIQQHRWLTLLRKSKLKIHDRSDLIDARFHLHGLSLCSGDMKCTVERDGDRLENVRCAFYDDGHDLSFCALRLRTCFLLTRGLAFLFLHASRENPGSSQGAD